MKQLILPIALGLLWSGCQKTSKTEIGPNEKTATVFQEPLRPQFHFSPPNGWLNDPNGLVYHEGLYHLFYQYYPNATVWGPMHWGHAVSTDMLQWEHKPIALYPDENGMIFSGSAVVDSNNTSGFGTEGKIPLVAIFTYHLMQGEKSGKKDFQTQGIAFSLDNGDTWTKYEGNPVIGNNGIKDLRDPKVFWHAQSEHWIMILVAGDHAKLYRSKNLKEWEYISDFGQHQGAHGGVWECPDLFELPVEGTDEEKWVLIISIGNGAPNGGSGTQYFIGDFDGTTFTSAQIDHKWLDWGADNYAGVTYNNVPNDDRIFIGWMSNWQYALKTPASSWRSAMTLPRKLTLRKKAGDYYLFNAPLPLEDWMQAATAKTLQLKAKEVHEQSHSSLSQAQITFTTPNQDLKLILSNTVGEELVLLLDAQSKLLMLDRTQSGATAFHYEFGNKLHYAAMEHVGDTLDFTLYLDRTSVEVFLNWGQYAMTDQLFPSAPFTQLKIQNLSSEALEIKDLAVRPIRSIRQD